MTGTKKGKGREGGTYKGEEQGKREEKEKGRERERNSRLEWTGWGSNKRKGNGKGRTGNVKGIDKEGNRREAKGRK